MMLLMGEGLLASGRFKATTCYTKQLLLLLRLLLPLLLKMSI